jgi:polygalacturonase
MQRKLGHKIGFALLAVIASAPICALRAASTPVVFNVKDYGATGQKQDNARTAIQNTIEAAAKAGGGTVYVPAGDYTTGTLHLRNHIRLFLDAGATLWATKDAKEYDAPSLIYAKDVDNITVDGRGTIDGQAEYVWRLTDHDDAYIRDNQLLAKAMGVPLMRSFPAGDAEHGFFPRMIHLVRCKDVRIAGISILHSPSWNINPYACERMVIDGIYIYSSPKEAVWADGIDPDGCKDLRIMNSTIVTGDDALVFYSSNGWGPALPCENITVTNCRFTSASSALKFCDGIQNCVRNVTIDNCVITAANRGIAFMNFSGGYVENVIISNIVINTQRFDWFWWGNGDPIYFSIRRNPEEEDNRPGTPPAGAIRNVILRNIIAHGQGSCEIRGHRESPLLNVSLENVHFYLSTDPKAAYDRSVNAFDFQYARNLKLKDVEVFWEKPESAKWQSALHIQDVDGLRIDGFSGGPAKPDAPAIILNHVDDASITNSKAEAGTGVFLKVEGSDCKGIYLVGNELHDAATPVEAAAGIVRAESNF